jgi:hypothetical protein
MISSADETIGSGGGGLPGRCFTIGAAYLNANPAAKQF